MYKIITSLVLVLLLVLVFVFGMEAQKPRRFYFEYEQEGPIYSFRIVQDGYGRGKYLVIEKGGELAICPLTEK